MATTTSLKPRESGVREVLKEMKEGFDDPSLEFFVPTLLREVTFSDDPRVLAWRAEAYHQTALRAVEQKDFDAANWRFGLSRRNFEENPLGLARETRDYAMMLCEVGEPELGLRRIDESLELHQEDAQGAKGRRRKAKADRQTRVTRSYRCQAQVLAGTHVDEAVTNLVGFALEDGTDFCFRDQLSVIRFTRPLVDRDTKFELDKRTVEVCSQRGDVTGTVTSIAHVVIDTELMVAGRLLSRALRRE